MNKLGFAIRLASQGAGNAIECNKGQWINKVVDIREYLKLFNGLQGTDNIVTFMSFDEGGCFLTQLRAISGRLGDFLSGWIYIPNTIEISGSDVLNAYNFVGKILSQSNLNDLKDTIDDFFAKEYIKKDYSAQYTPSTGEEYGVRFIDLYYSLKEIIDTNRYQPYYSKYKAIFLLNKNSEVKVAKEQIAKFKDLSKLTIDKTCILKSPSLEEVRILGKGAKIVFKDNHEFVSPLLTKKGDTIQLYAIRDGFEQIPLPAITIIEDVQTLTINPEIGKWQKRISAAMFNILDAKDHSLSHIAHIYIKNTDIRTHDIYLFEDECKNAVIVIKAKDFEDCTMTANLLLENIPIKMHRKSNEQQYPIVIKNGNIAQMTLESKSLSSEYSKNDSPLEGYSYNEGEHALSISSGFVWKQRMYGFLTAIVAIMLLVGYISFDSWIETYHFKFGLPPWEKDKTTETDTTSTRDCGQATGNERDSFGTKESAIRYIERNDVWVKTDMEKYSYLKGLYDDLNSYNLGNIYKRTTNLSSSEKLKKIIEIANKTINNKRGKHFPTYNPKNDERINVTNYTNWLDKDQSVAQTQQGNKPSKGEVGKSKSQPSGNDKHKTDNNGGL